MPTTRDIYGVLVRIRATLPAKPLIDAMGSVVCPYCDHVGTVEIQVMRCISCAYEFAEHEALRYAAELNEYHDLSSLNVPDEVTMTLASRIRGISPTPPPYPEWEPGRAGSPYDD